ncbi:MAG: HAD family hydrolase [Oscillospiraceae bacterium]|nr:HAD family hydrolase [Oscillospiraceae bacterium]
MAINTVLFDLDGTLLPMDQDEFIKAYMGRLARYMVPYGYDPDLLIKGLWMGTGAMVKNDGTKTNEKLFFEVFSSIVNRDASADIPVFETFYNTDFQNVKNVCGFSENSSKIIKGLKERGFRVCLATNPLFPVAATHSRVRWAGLDVEDFDLITTYENSSFSKPNLDYYREILEKTGCGASECAMVGNDVGEDMIAETLGMKTFLLTDCLINKTDRSVDEFAHGGFDELLSWLDTL